MDINWYGQALVRLKGKTATVIIDPFSPEFTGLKLPKDLSANVVLKTHDHQDHSNIEAVSGDPIKITGPGEYDTKGVAVVGIGVFHDKSQGSERGKNTMYNIHIDGLNVVHAGDLGHTLTQEQIDEIGLTDILLIPVGGVYTINAKEAVEVVAQLEPRIIIPIHYGGVPGLKFPLDPLDNFLKEMGAEGLTPQPKLSVTKDKLPDEPQVVVLSIS